MYSTIKHNKSAGKRTRTRTRLGRQTMMVLTATYAGYMQGNEEGEELSR